LKDEDKSSGGVLILSHEVGSVISWAMDGLIRIGSPALEALNEALHDENPLVRSRVQWAIDVIEGRKSAV
jgi:HEAT repeat protein